MVGIYAATRVPIAVFPETNFPRVVIGVDNGVMPVEQMQVTVTKPIGKRLRVYRLLGCISQQATHCMYVLSFWNLIDVLVVVLEVTSATSQKLYENNGDLIFDHVKKNA